MSAAAKASRQSPTSQGVPRRKPDFVRPYLTRAEVAALLELVNRFEHAELMADPSLSGVVTELRRWV